MGWTFTKKEVLYNNFFANDSIYPNEPARCKLDGPDDYLFFVDNPVHPKEPAFCKVGAQDKNLTLQIFRIGRPFVKKTIKMIISFCKSESSHRAYQAPSKVDGPDYPEGPFSCTNLFWSAVCMIIQKDSSGFVSII